MPRLRSRRGKKTGTLQRPAEKVTYPSKINKMSTLWAAYMVHHVISIYYVGVFRFLALADEEGTSASSEQEEDEEVAGESSDDDNDEGYKPPSGKKQRTGSVVSLYSTIFYFLSYHTV